ncbi:MAG TPA: LysR substrate-binding domain-containing protein [Nevskiaceae bacterium]|nr:LysR substrate-binding domain-containing protein [Nevskiaceae bacterium]
MDISFHQLRAFLSVAEAGHFRIAAERLHLTQPAVSRHIAQFEGSLGVRLFDRTTREVALTAAGAKLQQALQPLIEALDTVLAQARTDSEGLRGTVRVAAGPTPSAELMPQCIARCARDYPELTVLCHDRVQAEVIDAIRSGAVDFGLGIDPPDSDELLMQTILYDPFVLVCRREHPLARLRRIPWQRLAGERLVLLDHTSGSRRLIDASLVDRGIRVRVVQETGHTHTAFRMVEAGLGSSITVGLSAPRSHRLVTRPLTPEVRRAVKLVRRRDHSLSPAAQRVWHTLAELAGARPAVHTAGHSESEAPR